jgi:competence protein ComEC
MTHPGIWCLLAWVGGVAAQLQQAALWPLAVYMALLLAGLLLTGLLAVPESGWQRLRAHRYRACRRMILAVLAGGLCAYGLTGARAAHFAAQALAPALEGIDLVVSGRVASLPRGTERGERFEFAVESAQWQGRAVSLPERLQLSWYTQPLSAVWTEPLASPQQGPGLRAGDRWRFTVRLRSPHGNANPHGFDRERWLWEQGIGATGYVRTGARDPAPEHLGPSGRHPLERARQWVAQRIAQQVSDGRSAGVLAALVVGEQSAIERDDWDLFRITGVAHLMSISGLHVTLFAWLATALIARLWRLLAPHWPQALLGAPAPLAAGVGGVALALLYALFSGWGVPAQRTVLMLAVVVGLRLMVRPWPWPVVWLLAMAAVLVLDPWAWLQPGFWLSFVAVGILFASDPGRRSAAPAQAALGWAQRTVRATTGLVREQGVVTVALAPLTLLLFGQFSLVGLVANLLAIPAVTLVITPLALLGVFLTPLWTMAALAVQALGAVLAWLGHWSWSAVYVAVPPLPLALAAVLGGVLLVLRLPWAVRGAGLLLAWPLLLWSPPRPHLGQFELLAVDVGQGSAVLVRTATHSLLYDTGPRYSPDSDAGQRVVVPLLRALGERPDAVVVSHKDIDHAGGMEAVRATWPQARWLSSFDEAPERRCVAGQRWQWDGVDFEVLHPQPEHYRPDGTGLLSSNAMSCVLWVKAGSQSAWLGGDIDAAQETRLSMARPDMRATVLLAPHHGSKSSSSPVLLNTLQPRWVLVQSGYRNRFGHPAPLVLDRYRQRGIPWVTTPECGAATWRSAQPEMVHCHRQARLRYWHWRPHAGLWVGVVEGEAD